MAMTIYEAFQQTVERHGNREALAERDESGTYKPITYTELDIRVNRLVNVLSRRVKAGDRVAIMLNNGIPWVTIDLACAKIGAIVVPIHVSYNSHYVSHVLEHAEVNIVFMEGCILHKHEELIKKSLERLFVIIGEWGKVNQNNIQNWHDFLSYGNENINNDHNGAEQDDIFTIVYTSGTTGVPKGVMLSHKNILCNARAAINEINIVSSDRFFSFLPLSHIFERTAGYYVPLLSGASIYYCRSAKTLVEDIKVAQPTVLMCVPRIFEKIHESIISKFAKNAFLHFIFRRAMHIARSRANSIKARIWYKAFDRLVYRKVRDVFGGQLRFAVSGSASLSKHIAEFFNELGILVVEGYGLTEASPIVAMNNLDSYRFGTVGKPVKSINVKIDINGEILVKGESLMCGYYKSPDLTGQCIDEKGWFHTGDIGAFDDDGFLTILGRLKEMIALSTGKNIFPVPIEQALEESRYINQAMVYSPDQKSIAALIVPEFKELEKWCSDNGISYSFPQILTNAEIIKFYKEHILEKLAHFQTFEQVYNFNLVPEEFTVDNDLLSQTQKLKRTKIYQKYVQR